MLTNILAQDLGNGISRETLAEGRIVAFTLTSTSRAAVDTWIDSLRAELTVWPDERPVCILNDQSSMPNLILTPYMKSRLPDLVNSVGDKPGRSAILFRKSVILRFAMMVANSQTAGSKMRVRFFSDRAQALAWLQELQKPLSAPQS